MTDFKNLISSIREKKSIVEENLSKKKITDANKRLENTTLLFEKIFKKQLPILKENNISYKIRLLDYEMPNTGTVNIIFEYKSKTFETEFCSWRSDCSTLYLKFEDELLLLINDKLIEKDTNNTLHL